MTGHVGARRTGGASRGALVSPSCGLLLAALGAVVSVASCAPPPVGDFRPVDPEEVPQNTAVVYLYRPHSILGGVGGCNTVVGDEVVGVLDAGRYTRRFLPPGKTRFEAAGGWVAFVTVNLRAGEECFVRQQWHVGPTGFSVKLDHVPRISALQELETCTYVATPPLLEEVEGGEGR